MTLIVRTWKRDRSQNFMGLATACRNLLRHGVGRSGDKAVDEPAFASLLTRGTVCETKHAWFHLPEVKPHS